MNNKKNILLVIERVISPLKNFRGEIIFHEFLFVLSLIFMLSLNACSDNEPIVAEFGDQQISLDEYRTAYLEVLKQPDVFDSPELRESFLDELINRRLVANEARINGLGKDERTLMRIKAFKEKCLRDAHFQKIIKPKIVLEESDILDAAVFLKQQRHLKHLFAKTSEEAEKLYQRLEKSENWNALAREVFAGTTLAENGGDLGWVYWDQMEYEMGLVAFRQAHHTFSKPVKSNFGYHIIWVEGYRINPVISEYDVKQSKEHARYMLETKAGEKLAFEYIGRLMTNKKVKVYPETMKRVGEHLKNILRREPSQFDAMKNMQLQDDEVQKLEKSIWDIRKEPLIQIDEEIITVGEFIYALNFVPYNELHKSYRSAINYVIRDRVITDEAIRLGLESEDKQVTVRTRLYEEYILQLLQRRKVSRDIKVTDAEVREKFEQEKETRFKGADYLSIKPALERVMLKEKKIKTMNNYFQMLRAKNEIIKHTKIIHDYYGKL